jgi:hypothetical protein
MVKSWLFLRRCFLKGGVGGKVVGFDEELEIDRFAGPEAAVFAGPSIVDQLDRYDIEVDLSAAAVLANDDQLGFFEHAKVFHDGDATDFELSAQVVDAAAGMLLDEIQELSPSTVG